MIIVDSPRRPARIGRIEAAFCAALKGKWTAAMNPWKRLHYEFRALHEEESKILQDRASGECCYAYVVNPKSGEFDGWAERFPTEDLQARFELVATEAGIALGSQPETAPL